MQSLEQRFWIKVDKSGECWNWIASRGQCGTGYGTIGIGKFKKFQAHRLSWEMANGRKLIAGEIVMHSCDNKACVRPDHLSVGNQSKNILDMVKRGRCHNAILSDKDVLAIRSSKESSSILGKRHGITAAHARKVRRGGAKTNVMS